MRQGVIAIPDLSRARILVSNDDGIHAPGLEILEQIAHQLSSDVWVVAPELEQSGASHSMTLHRPLRIRQLAPQRYAIDGTPTDCVLLAVNEIMREARPALVLSGVNRGSNMGDDVNYSGTVAAAMEGTLLGVPSIALSLAVMSQQEPDWSTPLAHGAAVIERLVAAPWFEDCMMNVNFPNIPDAAVTGVQAASQGVRKLGDNLVRANDPRGRAYYWIGPVKDEAESQPGSDIQVIAANGISVTPIFLDRTHYAGLDALRDYFR